MFGKLRKHRRINSKIKNDNRGVTLVEVLVAIAILAVSFGPMLNSFVTASRVNRQSNITQNATTVAQNVFEGIKNFGLASAKEQCEKYATEPSQFKILAGDIQNAKFKDLGDDKYEFTFSGIECGGGKYYARCTVKRDTPVSESDIGRNNTSKAGLLTNFDVRYKYYYSVQIIVYKDNGGAAGEVLTEYNGSMLDYYKPTV